MKSSLLKSILCMVLFYLLPFCSFAQISSVSIKDAKATISNQSLGKVIVEVCGECRVAGHNHGYAVIYNRSKAVIYNNRGKIRATISLRRNYKIIEVNNDYIIIDDGTYFLYYDFQGSFQKRALKNY